MNITRAWHMPSKDTFTIKPIREFIEPHLSRSEIWIDPFVRNSIFKDRMASDNDINPEFKADHHMPAIEYLKGFGESTVDGVLFDPPYSPTQIKRAYEGIGVIPQKRDTQACFWGDAKDEIARLLRPGGKLISFGWNSNGAGKGRGFRIEEILIVAHGAAINDTICVLEIKEV